MNKTKIEELKKGLTEDQKLAVEAEGKGYLRISAGAGSGKTEVLTRRIVSLLEQGIKPEEMVAITYTTKAAAEMKERLTEKQKLPHHMLRKMEISTFHAFLKNFLGEDPFGAGLDRSNEIISDIERSLLIDDLKNKFAVLYGQDMMTGEYGLGPETANAIIDEFGSALVNIRRFILTPAEFYRLAKEKFAERDKAPGNGPLSGHKVSDLEKNTLEWLYKFYTCYIEELDKRSVLDFDEILIRSGKLIRDLRDSGTEPVRRVFLIDEFQDNNKEQFNIVKLFCDKRDSHICVVGDEKQSIYSFQGADVSTFRDFEADKDIALKDNFRSYEEIISLSDAYLEKGGDVGKLFVKQNARRGPSPEQPAVVCMIHNTDMKDSEKYIHIADYIENIIKSGLLIDSRKDGKKRPCTYGDIAIIVPSVRRLPPEFEEELVKLNIPYVLSGGMGFYGRSEITELLSFLTLLVYPNDGAALVKLLTGPLYGLNDSDVVQIFSEGRSGKVSMMNHLLAKPDAELPKNAVDFKKLYVRLKELASESTLLNLTYTILEQAGFYEYVASQPSELQRRRINNNLSKFLTAVRTFERSGLYTSIRDFLAYVERILEAGDEEEAGLGLEDKNVLKILTIHKSKGLEFPIVICPDIENRKFVFRGKIHFNRENGLIVSDKKQDSTLKEDFKEQEKTAAEAEERRKLYVAFTRAENKLIIIGAKPEEKPVKESKDKEPPKPTAIQDVCSILTENPLWGEIYDFENRQNLLDKWIEVSGQAISEEDENTAKENSENQTDKLSPETLGESIKSITAYLKETAASKGLEKENKQDNIFSLQDLAVFESCPRKYFLSKKHTKSFADAKKSRSAITGTLVHETIRLYHAYELHAEQDRSKALEKAAKILDKLVPAYGEIGEQSKARAGKIIEQYLKSELGTTAPAQTEAEVNVKFDSGFFIRGFADRVDRFENGDIRIVDYKTRSYSPEAHERYKKQLALYRIAAQQGVLGEIGGLNITSSYIAYMTPDKLQLVEIEPDMLKFEDYAREITDKIAKSSSDEMCEDLEKCSKCGYASICGRIKPESEEITAENAQERDESLPEEDYMYMPVEDFNMPL